MIIQQNNTPKLTPARLDRTPQASDSAPQSNDQVTLNSQPSEQGVNWLKTAGILGGVGLAAVALPSVASAATTEAAGQAAGQAAAQSGLATVGQIAGQLLPIAGLGLMGFMAWKMLRPMMNGGGSDPALKGGNFEMGKSDKTFADVAGAPEAKEELMEVVDFLKNPEKYAKMGAKIPRGVLLSGSPGNGKTLLAKAVAGEAGVNFIATSGSDFVEKYVGVGASRMRELFEKAKKNQPCIIFIDEIDAVGGQRTGSNDGGQEREATLNALLVQMDGFAANSGVVVMAATNRPDMLDSALTRSGRFDRKVTVGVPNREGREKILEVHAKGKPLANPADLKLVADRTTGMSGADMANVMNEAALMAVRRGHDKITLEDLSEAIDRVARGPQVKSRILTGKEKRITAYHEGGHALISHILPSNGQVNKITILPRGQANGLCWTSPTEQRSMYEEGELRNQICMLLGGRAAEELTQVDITTGASNDIERATEIAKGIVMEYGMTDLGQVKYVDPMSRENGHKPGSGTQDKIDAEVKKIMDEEYARAKRLISENMDSFRNMSEVLLQKEEIDRPELLELLKNVKQDWGPGGPPAPPAPPAETPAAPPAQGENKAA